MKLRDLMGVALLFVVPLVLAVVYSGPAVQAATGAMAPDAKAIFLGQKCNLCHSVQAAGVEATTKSDKMKGPELTASVAKKDAAALAKYVKKETEMNGKKHPKEWKGTDAELAAVIDWLKKPAKQ